MTPNPARHLSGRRRVTLVTAAAMLLAGPAVALPAAHAPEVPTSSPSIDVTAAAVPSRVVGLVGAMTLDEKLSMLHGGSADPLGIGAAGYIPGVPRLGVPALRLADGPAGVRVNQHATALPAPVALASSFDAGLAKAFGEVIGRDGRALGVDVLLSPMTNEIRVPTAGRNFETFSEDPLLAARTVAGEVGGITSGGLIATIKHFAANNQEQNRSNVDVEVAEQTLRETELVPFEAAVNAGAGAVMCSYNKVNGVYACENDRLLNTVLRDEWGFAGWVMSDWFATHSTAAIAHGQDMEMPSGIWFGDSLKAAITAGQIPESTIDRSVTRILTQMERVGLLDEDPAPRPARDAAGGARVAQRVAEQGAVLLKNQGKTLPLSSRGRGSVAVIGPTAQTPVVTGGGSSRVLPDEPAAAPLDAIRARAGRTTVNYSVGEDLEGVLVPASALHPSEQINHTGAGAIPAGSSLSWTGTLTAPEAGTYTLSLQTTGAGAAATLDGSPILSTRSQFGAAGGSLIATRDGLTNDTYYVDLAAGSTHTLSITGAAGTAELQARFQWVTPSARKAAVAAAVATAKKAGTAVVFAYDEGSEGVDRPSLALPGTQDALIAAVAAANPRTVVVLNTGSSVTMPWAASVRSILETWYPGQEGAEATARLLYGDVNPSGKLSQTFPLSESATPVAGDPLRYPGVDGTQQYSEGIFVGYRWYDANHETPLFSFGHGLSYTRFDYRGLTLHARKDGRVDVSFRVTNTGSRSGAEVPQVYVGPAAHVDAQQAVRALAGYDKVRLNPGQTRKVKITLERRQLSHWDTSTGSWQLGTGKREVWVGGSSVDLPLHGKVRVRG